MTPSTAEALYPLAPPINLQARRRSEVAWYIRSTISTEEAEGLASSGYRPLRFDCGPCGRRGCLSCDSDPIENVQGSRGKGTATDPRFVRVLVARLGQFDPLLVRHCAAAVRELPAPERLALVLELGCGLTQDQVATQLRVSRATVQRLKWTALDKVVRRVWG